MKTLSSYQSRRPQRRVASTILVAFFAVIALSGVVFTSARAAAVYTSIAESGTAGYLSLSVAKSTPLWATLEPGQSMHWLIRASLADASTGSLAIEIRGTGDLVSSDGLTGQVQTCSGDIDPETLACAEELAAAIGPVALRDLPANGDRIQLAELHQDVPRDLLVTLTLPDDNPNFADQPVNDGPATAQVGLGVHVAGAQLPVTSPPRDTELPYEPPTEGLAVTGADLLPLGLLSVGLAGLGVVLALRIRARTREQYNEAA